MNIIITSLLSLVLFSVGCAKGTNCDRVFQKVLKAWARESRSLDLFPAGTGGGIRAEKIARIGITFDTEQVMDVEFARKKLIEACSLLYNIVDVHPECLECFPDRRVNLKEVSIAILGPASESFDKDIISSVSLHSGRISYDRIDPKGKVQPYIHVHDESYETALKIVQEKEQANSNDQLLY